MIRLAITEDNHLIHEFTVAHTHNKNTVTVTKIDLTRRGGSTITVKRKSNSISDILTTLLDQVNKLEEAV